MRWITSLKGNQTTQATNVPVPQSAPAVTNHSHGHKGHSKSFLWPIVGGVLITALIAFFYTGAASRIFNNLWGSQPYHSQQRELPAAAVSMFPDIPEHETCPSAGIVRRTCLAKPGGKGWYLIQNEAGVPDGANFCLNPDPDTPGAKPGTYVHNVIRLYRADGTFEDLGPTDKPKGTALIAFIMVNVNEEVLLDYHRAVDGKCESNKTQAPANAGA